MSSEEDRPGRVEIARKRQKPENDLSQLVPEALNMIRAVAHNDPDIELALKGLSDKDRQAFKDAEDVTAFKRALSAFSDRSIHVVAGSLKIMDESIAVMNGRPGNTLEEIFNGNKDFISYVEEVKAAAKAILRQIRSEILFPERESALTR